MILRGFESCATPCVVSRYPLWPEPCLLLSRRIVRAPAEHNAEVPSRCWRDMAEWKRRLGVCVPEKPWNGHRRQRHRVSGRRKTSRDNHGIGKTGCCVWLWIYLGTSRLLTASVCTLQIHSGSTSAASVWDPCLTGPLSADPQLCMASPQCATSLLLRCVRMQGGKTGWQKQPLLQGPGFCQH